MREFAAEDFRKEIARERRASMAVAKAFAKAAEAGRRARRSTKLSR